MEQTSVHSSAIILIAGGVKSDKTKSGKDFIKAYGRCLTRGNGYQQPVCLNFYGANMEAAKRIKSGDVVFAHGGSNAIVMPSKKEGGKPYAMICINVADWTIPAESAAEMQAANDAWRANRQAATTAAKPAADGESDEVPF